MIRAVRVAPLLRSFGAVAPLAVPQLSIADHGDNSGATATIAGAALGSTNQVLVQAFAEDFATAVSGGSTSGNGAVELDLARAIARGVADRHDGLHGQRHREREAVVVVGVFTDQVDPSRRPGHQ